jgi:arylsulfatase A-like enzyme
MKALWFLALITAAHAGNNVLLIIADDLGTNSQSLYNTNAGATAPTPHINALAASGVRFTNAYSSPVCSAARACMITGRHGFRTGVGDNGTPGQVIQTPYDAAHAKDTLYEGGIRVPLIIKGPDVVAGGRTNDSLVQAVDLFSTILELAGVPLPSNITLDSKSLKPILSNLTATRTRLYTDQFDQNTPTTGGRVLRDDRYKLIRLNTGTDEFYDLLADPFRKSVSTACFRRRRNLAEAVCDPMPLRIGE